MSALVSMKLQGSDARNPLGVRGKNHGGWERLSGLVSMKFQGSDAGNPLGVRGKNHGAWEHVIFSTTKAMRERQLPPVNIVRGSGTKVCEWL